MQEILTTPIISAGSRSLMPAQDRSSITAQALSTGHRLSKPSDTPPPVKSRGSNPKNDVYLMRRIIAEDAEWSLAIVPLLTELCIQHIVKNFQSESVPAWGGKEKARNGARWVGTGWRRGLRGWVLGKPLLSRHSILITTQHFPLPLQPGQFLLLSPLPGPTRLSPTLCAPCLCPLLTCPTLSSKTQPKPYLPPPPNPKYFFLNILKVQFKTYLGFGGMELAWTLVLN